jgi:hypothetical protein
MDPASIDAGRVTSGLAFLMSAPGTFQTMMPTLIMSAHGG